MSEKEEAQVPEGEPIPPHTPWWRRLLEEEEDTYIPSWRKEKNLPPDYEVY